MQTTSVAGMREEAYHISLTSEGRRAWPEVTLAN